MAVASAISVLLTVAVIGTAPTPHGAHGGEVPQDEAKMDCNFLRGKTLTWFEESCPDHVSNETKLCIEILEEERLLQESQFSNHESDSTIAHEISHGEPPWGIIVIFGSFGCGALVRFLFKETSVPYTVVLFVIGTLWGGLGRAFKGSSFDRYIELGDMNPHLIFHIFLPVLIFESAFAMEIPIFRKVVRQCIILAGPGLVVASALTAVVAKFTFSEYNWTWEACLLLGTILSATDPVAVVALLKELGASPEISTMIEGESLFNDGTAIVFFTVLKEAVLRKNCVVDWNSCFGKNGNCVCTEYTCKIPSSAGEVISHFLTVSLGGPAVGLAVGLIAVIAMQRVFNDALIEITITIVAAYITFFVSEGLLGVSGVLGVVVCGLVLSYNRHAISPEVEHTMHAFWETVVYLTNTMIFILAGMIVSLKAFDSFNKTDFLYLGAIYLGINIIRFFVLMLFMPLLNCFGKLSRGEALLIGWGGLRGAVGLALALIVQADGEVISRDDTVRTKFVFHVAGIVILTLCVNGTTTKKLVEYYKLNRVSERSKNVMRKCFSDLVDYQRETIIDLRCEALYYDTNWELLQKLTDIVSLIPKKNSDPYSKKDEKIIMTEETLSEDTKGVYLNTMYASVHQQYADGTMESESARALLRMAEKMKGSRVDKDLENNPDQWVQPSMVGRLFELGRVGDPTFCCGMFKKLGLQQRYILRKWKNAFEVALAFNACHKLVEARAVTQLPPSSAGRLIKHCRRVSCTTSQLAEDAIASRLDLSCNIKSKHAARHVLNHMKKLIDRSFAEGRCDSGDRQALLEVVEARMKYLKTAKNAKILTTEKMLEEAAWFAEAEEEAKDTMLAALKLGSMYEVEVMPGEKIERFETQKRQLTGAYYVVSGVVQIRVGMQMFLQGPGYTIGLHQLLMPDDVVGRRFNDAWAECKCKLLYIPYQLMFRYMEQFPLFREQVWLVGGRAAAEIILRKQPRWSPPLVTPRMVVNMTKEGKVEGVLPPEEFTPDDTRKIKIPPFCSTILMKGKCWEYEVESDEGDIERVNEIKAPDLIPRTFKFATFSGHAVIFVIPEPSKPGDAARRHWRRLAAKIRSINLWVGLRGEYYRKNAMATIFGRTPIHVPEKALSDASSLPGSRSSRKFSSPLSVAGNAIDAGFGPSSQPLSSPPHKESSPRLQATVASLMAENKALQQAVKSAASTAPQEPVSAPPSVQQPLSQFQYTQFGDNNGFTNQSQFEAPSTNPLLSNTSELHQVGDAFSPTVGPSVIGAPASPIGTMNASPTLMRAASLNQFQNPISSTNASPFAGSQSPLFGLSSAHGSTFNGIGGSPTSGLNGRGTNDTTGLVPKMQELATLHNTGVLTAEEFTLAKMKLLGIDSPPSQQRAVQQQRVEPIGVTPQQSLVGSPTLTSSPRLLDSNNPQLISELKKKYLGSRSSLSGSGGSASNESLTQCLL
eukprot:TRINITY_DN1491_c8_g1_i1.p1 TRINITY_DN1491_c8_g1~~TRINITY_DN1491_c8_g1_i1.p1  ORF type:complete len:1446 (+),score=269.52 TRINITY_DN1491_c8_g1_i1:117-4454(+)